MIQTTLCYLERGDQYLMLHRVKKEHDVNRGKWVGVGGKFQEGESPEECVRREVLEETGLTLTDQRFRGLVTFVYRGADGSRITEYMHLFTSEHFSGELIDCDEGELEWVPIGDVPKLPIWEGDRLFFGLLQQERPFFSLKLVYEGDRLAHAELDGESLHTDQHE